MGVRVAPPATRTTSSLLSQLSTTTQDHPFSSSEDFLISFATVVTTVANAIVIWSHTWPAPCWANIPLPLKNTCFFSRFFYFFCNNCFTWSFFRDCCDTLKMKLAFNRTHDLVLLSELSNTNRATRLLVLCCCKFLAPIFAIIFLSFTFPFWHSFYPSHFLLNFNGTFTPFPTF